MTDGKKHIFVIGSKGIPASYGGFETFVEKLTAFKKSEELVYHVACMGGKEERFTHNGADCFRVKVPNIGPGKAVYYDIAALNASIRYYGIEQNWYDYLAEAYRKIAVEWCEASGFDYSEKS